MPARIRFLPSGHEFIAQKNETILEAALRSGLSPGYSCDRGSCGECKARLISGEISKQRYHDFTLSDVDKSMGYVLLCSITANTDLVIETAEAGSVRDIPLQQIMTRVTRLERLQEDIMVLHLRTPRTRTLRFFAGQHVRLSVGNIMPRDIPIASCPCNAMHLQFHIENNADDAFSRHVFTRLATGDTVPLLGPMGEFTLDETSTQPMIFLAYGAGFAPLKSIIEHAISLETGQPMHLYWVARRDGGHYMANYCRSWADALDNFRFTPLVTVRTDSMSAAPGQTQPESWKTDAVEAFLKDYPDPSGMDVYMCGPHSVVDKVRSLLQKHGMPSARIHAASQDRL